MEKAARRSLPTPRAQPGQKTLAWVLSLLLLAQAVIPLQSHTRLAVDDQGMVVEVCTLLGPEQQALSLRHAEAPDSDDTDSQASPAMAFSQLMAEALLALDMVQPSWLALQASEIPSPETRSPYRRPHRLATIRAPPGVS